MNPLELAEKGFWIFPLAKNSKVPIRGIRFKKEATKDFEKIKNWINQYPDCNWGIFTEKFKESEALVCVDIDNKKEKMGDSELLRLELKGMDFPATLEQRTPNGRHLIYRTEQAVRGGVDVLARGLDIRSRGGYVVASGSVIDGARYEMHNREVARSPQWLVDQCGAPSEKPQQSIRSTPTAIDQTSAKMRAVQFVMDHARPSLQGSRNHTAFTIAARIKDLGLNEAECLEVILDHWPTDLTGGEIQTIVSNAYKYGENKVGNDSPEAEFKPVEMVVDEKKVDAFEPTDFKDVTVNFNQPALIEKYLGLGGLSLIYGDSNIGKTFFAMDLALHVSMGRTWMDLETKKGGVLYIAAEGGIAIKERVLAFRKHHNLEDEDLPFGLICAPVDLLNSTKDAKKLIETAKAFEEKHGTKIELIVIDTVARAFCGGDENSSKDMGNFIANVDKIRELTKAHVLLIHHSGKNRDDARGHSSLRAAVDTEIHIKDKKARLSKQRNMKPARDIDFNLVEVLIGHDNKQRQVHSCVIERSNSPAVKDFSKEELKGHTLSGKAFKTLQNMLARDVHPAPDELDLPDGTVVVALAEFRDTFFKEVTPNDKGQYRFQAFTRVIRTLVDDGYIGRSDNWVWINA